MRNLTVVEYDPSWPGLFEAEREILLEALGDNVVDIHHIGSTAVPGSAAKPVIDILVEVADIEALDGLNREMEAIDYEPKGEFGIPGRRYFRKGGDERTHHVHAFKCGDSNVTRHLAFRDYLIANPQIAQEYGELKKSIAETCDKDISRYCDRKDAYVKRIEAVALKEMTRSKPQADD